ncbi:MAG: hypothetical protein JNK75_10880 [Betaproteobacteria bacterium]|nr:hypothetical protein [Betaproteobacteria bacterium]
MTDLRESASFRARRFAGIIALVALLVAGAIGGGSWWLWEREKKLAALSKRDFSNAAARLETIKRERDDLLGSEDTYRMLVARGVFAPEQRLDLIESLKELRARYRLQALEYEVAPQRALRFATGVSYGAADIRASRLTLKVRAASDADLIGFLDEFPRIRRGFFPLDQCAFKRENLRAGATAAPGNPPPAGAAPAPAPGSRQPVPAEADGGAIEAECSGEWITLVEKNPAGVPAAPTGQAAR